MVRVFHEVKVKFENITTNCLALFDTGAAISVIKKSFVEKNFGQVWKKLRKSRFLYWINGSKIEVDKYIELTLIINNVELEPPETILVVDNFIDEIEVNGRKIKLPDLIIGSSTIDKYGIVIHPEKGIEIMSAVLII